MLAFVKQPYGKAARFIPSLARISLELITRLIGCGRAGGCCGIMAGEQGAFRKIQARNPRQKEGALWQPSFAVG